MIDTYIIIVNWNGSHDTIECLESLLRLEEGGFRVIVVDNGSTDRSVECIQNWASGARRSFEGPVWGLLGCGKPFEPTFKQIVGISTGSLPEADITLIEARQNLGFAAANNLGMDFAARDLAARYYWILNNDTVVASNSLSVQRRRMKTDPNTAMLGARLMYYSDPDVVQGLAGGFNRFLARGFHYGLGLTPGALPREYEVETAMAYVLGASMFVRRAVIDDIGGMSTAYFLYFEEIDWAARLPSYQRLGVAYDAVVWHKEGASIGSNTKARPSDTSLYYLNASLLRFYFRNDRLLLPLAFLRSLREAFGFARRGDFAAASVILRSVYDVVRRKGRRGRYGSAEFERPNH